MLAVKTYEQYKYSYVPIDKLQCDVSPLSQSLSEELPLDLHEVEKGVGAVFSSISRELRRMSQQAG